MIEIKKVGDGYIVQATPPHVEQEWRNPVPLSRSDLVNQLRSLGVHTADIGDAFYAADPDWLSR